MIPWFAILSTLFIFLTYDSTSAQEVFQYEEEMTGEIILADSITIPYEHAGYTLLMPENGKPLGVILFFNANRDPLQYNAPPHLEYYALNAGLALLYITTGNRLDFFFDEEAIEKAKRYLRKAIHTYDLPDTKFVLAGMSLGGTRALRFFMNIQSKRSRPIIQVNAIAICDSPLDFVRFHKEMTRARDLNFNPEAANEGAWVSSYLEKNLGGTPENNLQNYLEYSPYSYFGEQDNYTWLFSLIPLRAYTEPDIQWWMENRRKSYYGMNAVDLAAFINELHILGNRDAELITTENLGELPDGTRHPHSWSIVDNEELVQWFLYHLTE